MKRSRHQSSLHRGFTLIEAIATITVLAILGALASVIILNASDGYLSANTRAQLQQDASMAIEQIVRELRAIEQQPDADGVMPHITHADSDRIEWNGGNTLVRHEGTLKLAIDGEPLQVLLEDVLQFRLRAYDADNEPFSLPCTDEACARVRRLEVRIVTARHGEEVTLRTRIFIRAMMNEATGGGA